MKSVLIALGLLTLGWVAPLAAADMTPLANNQLDMVVAGEFPDDIDDIKAFQNNSTSAQVDASSYMSGDALNPVNFSAPSVDTSNNAINEVLVLKDEAQKDARAVQVINDIGGQIAFGSNVNVGGLERNLSESGTGSRPFLNQSNIIIQNR